ncbi:MAG: hypothetical protein RLY31_2681 [Bacteroidota bacterium]
MLKPISHARSAGPARTGCRWFLLLALAGGLFQARAQQVTVSEPVSVREDHAYYILGDDRGHVLLLRDKQTTVDVQGYDAEMRLHWEKEIELDKKSPAVLDVINRTRDFCLLYLFRQRSQPVLKAHRYNAAANLLDSATIKVFEDALYAPFLQVTCSEDKSVGLVWYVQQQRDVTAIAFDLHTLQVRWEYSFAPEGVNFALDQGEMLVSNQGDMYFVLRKANRNSRQWDHYLEIFDYGPSTQQMLRRYIVPMEGILTYDAVFSFDNLNQCLKAGGLYAEENSNRADGFYYLSVNPRDLVAPPLFRRYAFQESFIAILKEKEKLKNKGLEDVSVREIIHRRDGGIILLGELNKEFQRGMSTASYYNRASFRPIIDYYYDDIFLLAFHPDGALHWDQILHKKQYSQDDDAAYSSYFLAKTPAALRLVFNDEIKQGNTVSEYVVKANGDFGRHAVMNTERKDLSLRFREAVQLSANEIIVPSERRNKLKLVRVTY